mmetsp:Transcript_2017/g.2421  ORF Transcript_2017/g.2421 Transcript_2017/m.2421 type:complete len:311 (+) Transcript_2017:454-1386(+)
MNARPKLLALNPILPNLATTGVKVPPMSVTCQFFSLCLTFGYNPFYLTSQPLSIPEYGMQQHVSSASQRRDLRSSLVSQYSGSGIWSEQCSSTTNLGLPIEITATSVTWEPTTYLSLMSISWATTRMADLSRLPQFGQHLQGPLSQLMGGSLGEVSTPRRASFSMHSILCSDMNGGKSTAKKFSVTKQGKISFGRIWQTSQMHINWRKKGTMSSYTPMSHISIRILPLSFPGSRREMKSSGHVRKDSGFAFSMLSPSMVLLLTSKENTLNPFVLRETKKEQCTKSTTVLIINTHVSICSWEKKTQGTIMT